MDEKTVAALLETRREMGADFLRNTQRVRAFLSDFLPAQPGERRYAERQMLVSLLEAGVPQQLAARHPWSDAELAALAQRSAASLLLDAQATHQGVRVWHFVTRVGVDAMPLNIQAILGGATQALQQQPQPAAPQLQQPKPLVRRPAPPAPPSPPRKNVPGLFKQELASAVEKGDVAKVQRLLDVGADANAVTSVYVPGRDRRYKGHFYETTVLIRAVEKSQAQTVKLLLSAGADVNAHDERHCTAFEAAAYHATNAEIFRFLLDAGEDVNTRKGFALKYIIENRAYGQDSEKIIKVLLDAGADVNAKYYKKGYTALMLAIKTRHTGIVKLLLDAGADVNVQNSEGVTAMMLAFVEGNEEIIQMLQAAGATGAPQPSKPVPQLRRPQQPLPVPTSAPRMPTPQQPQTPQSSHLPQKSSSLMSAARDGDLTEIRRLLATGADVNAQDEYGRTALMLAAQEKHIEAVKLLLASGASVKAEDKYGRSALWIADTKGYTEIAQLLRAPRKRWWWPWK